MRDIQIPFYPIFKKKLNIRIGDNKIKININCKKYIFLLKKKIKFTIAKF